MLRCPACFSVRRNSAGKCVSYVHKALVTFPDIQRVLKPNPDSFRVLVLVHEDAFQQHKATAQQQEVTRIECTSVGSALRKRDRYLHNAVHSVSLTRTCVSGIIGEALNGSCHGGVGPARSHHASSTWRRARIHARPRICAAVSLENEYILELA